MKGKILYLQIFFLYLFIMESLLIHINNQPINFKVTTVGIDNRDQENIFKDNKKTLGYRLDKLLSKSKGRLREITQQQKDKYSEYLNLSLGEFLLGLKETNNDDYRLYLNKYGDKKFCNYHINEFGNSKGIYCYIVNDEIVYVGRSKMTFNERFRDYGKITPYKCLNDGQSTNCKINSKVNDIEKLKVGFYLMDNFSDKEIEVLEKEIINTLKETHNLWNHQLN